MAWEQPGFCITGFKAATTLSTSQFKFVKQTSSNGVSAVSAATDQPLGLLRDNPTSGGEAQIGCYGVFKGRAAGAITQGAHVGPSTNGFVITLTAASTKAHANVHGSALDTVSAANEIVTVFLNIMPGLKGTS